MDSFLLAYITQRMNERGYCHFHWEPGIFDAANPPAIIKAYNTFIYTTGFPFSAGIQIISDTNIYRGDGGILQDTLNNARYNYYGIQEFTGLIEIKKVGEIKKMSLIEYIYVIPTCKENFCVKRVCCENENCK